MNLCLENESLRIWGETRHAEETAWGTGAREYSEGKNEVITEINLTLTLEYMKIFMEKTMRSWKTGLFFNEQRGIKMNK